MRKISYQDFQLDIESLYQKEVEKDFDRIFKDDTSKFLTGTRENKNFYSLLKYAIEIKEHYAVRAIENRIKGNLLVDVSLNIYLYQAAVFNVSCFPRLNTDGKTELQIFVSQHFFNNLSEDEQVAIIGHEVAHYLFDHLKYPTKEIIKYPLEANVAGDIKSNLIYWTKASEITADVIGLLCNDINFKSYSTAIIKHTTGLSDSANSMFSISPLIDLVLKQYEHFAEDPHFHDLHSMHPLMHLRVKVINTVAKTQLVRHFGEELSEDVISKYKEEYNSIINSLVKTVYPEIFPNEYCVDEIIIPMSIAVMLSDGVIEDGEKLEIEKRVMRANGDFKEYLKLLATEPCDFNVLKDRLIDKSVELAKSKNFDKSVIIPIIRVLVLVAASDGNIDKSELIAIYKFAKEFDISKEEIVFLMETQYKV